MYADRHFAQKRANPYSLSASALIVGGALAAALLIKGTTYYRSHDEGMEIFDVKYAPPPPPPIREEVKPKPSENKVQSTPLTHNPDTLIKTPVEQPEVGVIQPPFPEPPTNFGTGTGTTAEPPPLPPPPLFVEPALDPRAELQPPYPSSEVRAGREGSVAVRVLIGVDGRVKDVQKIRATSDAFFEATRRQALGRWRFKPATRGGIPEESWKTLSLRFVLENR